MSRTARSKNVFQAVQRSAFQRGNASADWEPDYNRADFVKTDALPGSEEKIGVLAERARKGLPLWHKDDRRTYECDNPADLERLLSSGRDIRRKTREQDDELLSDIVVPEEFLGVREQTQVLAPLVMPPISDCCEMADTEDRPIVEEPIPVVAVALSSTDASTAQTAQPQAFELLQAPPAATTSELVQLLQPKKIASEAVLIDTKNGDAEISSPFPTPIHIEKMPARHAKKSRASAKSKYETPTASERPPAVATQSNKRDVIPNHRAPKPEKPLEAKPKRSEILALLKNLEDAVAAHAIHPSELEQFTQQHSHIISPTPSERNSGKLLEGSAVLSSPTLIS